MQTKDKEIIIKKGERHYLWPIKYVDGNHAKCGQCAYYRYKKVHSPYCDGECTSVCCNTERGYIHNRAGNDFSHSRNMACKWFILPEDTEVLSNAD